MSNTQAHHIEPLSDHDALPSEARRVFCEAPHSYLASNYDPDYHAWDIGALIRSMYQHAAQLTLDTYGYDHPCFLRLRKMSRA